MNVPNDIRDTLFRNVANEADEFDYLTRTRSENSTFIQNLVKHREIGMVLRNYGEEAEIKTYIKDSLLNQYSKKKRTLLRDVSNFLPKIQNGEINEISYDSKTNISVHFGDNQIVFIVARATYTNWEIGLKKLILHAAAHPNLIASKNNTKLFLLIFLHERIITDSDKRLIESSLKVINVLCAWVL